MVISEKLLRDQKQLEVLLSTNNQNIMVNSDDLQSALSEACQLGNLTKSVQLLLDRGANPNFIPNKNDNFGNSHLKSCCLYYNTPLQLCVINDDCKTAELLLSRKADPNLIIENYTQIEETAAKIQKLDALITSKDKNGKSSENYLYRNYPPLHLSTRHGHLSMVSLLLRWGAEQTPLIETGECPIHIAAREGHVHIIELFCTLDKKWINWKTEVLPNVNDKSIEMYANETPLHIACKNGHIDCVSFLINHLKADYKLKDRQANTALHSLVNRPISDTTNFLKDSENKFSIACLLVKCKDFDINSINSDGYSALSLSAKNKYSKIAQLLNDVGGKAIISNANEFNTVPVEVYSNDEDEEKNLNNNNNMSTYRDKKSVDVSSHNVTSTITTTTTTVPNKVITNVVTTANFTSFTTTNPSDSLTTIAKSPPVITTSFKENNPKIEHQKYFLPNIDNEISSFILSNKEKSERMYISFDKQSNQKSPTKNIASNQDNKNKDAKYPNKPTEMNYSLTREKVPVVNQNDKQNKYDPMLLKKVTSKDISITKTTIWSSTLDNNLSEHKIINRDREQHFSVFDPNKKFFTIRCSPRDMSSISCLSEGGQSRGLKLRVHGEVPKAYNKLQKDSARKKFIMAKPIGIESTEDISDRSRLSVNSLPEFYANDELWQKSIERREEWLKPLKSITTVVKKDKEKKIINSNDKKPVCDLNVNSNGIRVDGKLIGFATRPYKSFGPINTNTDALEQAMQEMSEEDGEHEPVGNFNYNKYPVMKWLSDDAGKKFASCPIDSGEDFSSSPDEKSLLRPKPNDYDESEDDETKRLSSSSVKVNDVILRLVEMPDVDDDTVKDKKPTSLADTDPKKIFKSEDGSLSQIQNNKPQRVISTVIQSFQPGIQKVEITDLKEDDNEEEKYLRESEKEKIPSSIEKNKNCIRGKTETISGLNKDKTTKPFKKKTTKQETVITVVSEFKQSSNDYFESQSNSKSDIQKNVEITEENDNSLKKRVFKSKIPVYRPQLSSDNQIRNDNVRDENNFNTKREDSSQIKVNEKYAISNLRENKFPPQKTLDVFVNIADPKDKTNIPSIVDNEKVNAEITNDEDENKSKNVSTKQDLNYDKKSEENIDKNNSTKIPSSPSDKISNFNEQLPKSHAHDVPCVRIKKKSRPKIDDNYMNMVTNKIGDDANEDWAQKVILTMINSKFWKDETEKNEYQKEINNLDDQINKSFESDVDSDADNAEVDENNSNGLDNNRNFNVHFDNQNKKSLNETFEKGEEKDISENVNIDDRSSKMKNKKKVKKAKSTDNFDPEKIKSQKISNKNFDNEDKSKDGYHKTNNDVSNNESGENVTHILNKTFDKETDETNVTDENKQNIKKVKKHVKKSKTIDNAENMPDLIRNNSIEADVDDITEEKTRNKKKLKKKIRKTFTDSNENLNKNDNDDVNFVPKTEQKEEPEKKNNGIIDQIVDDKNIIVPAEEDMNNLDVLIPVYLSEKNEPNVKDKTKTNQKGTLVEENREEDGLNKLVHAVSTDEESCNVNKISDKNNNDQNEKQTVTVKPKSTKERSKKTTKNVVTSAASIDKKDATPKPTAANIDDEKEIDRLPKSKQNDIFSDNDANIKNEFITADTNFNKTVVPKEIFIGVQDKHKVKLDNKGSKAVKDKNTENMTVNTEENRINIMNGDSKQSRETNVDDLSDNENFENTKKIDLDDDEDEINYDVPFPPLPSIVSGSREEKNKENSKKRAMREDNLENSEELSDRRKSDIPTSNGHSDSEVNSSDPDASNYLEYHVDMDPRVTGKFRIKKTKDINYDDEDEDEDVDDEEEFNNQFIKRDSNGLKFNNDTTGVFNPTEEVRDSKSEDKIIGRKKDKKIKPHSKPSTTEITTTSTTVVVLEDTIDIEKIRKKNKKCKLDKGVDKLKDNHLSEDDIEKSNEIKGPINPMNDMKDKNLRKKSSSIEDEIWGYTSDDINVADDYSNDDYLQNSKTSDSSKVNEIENISNKSKVENNDNIESLSREKHFDQKDVNLKSKKNKGKKSFEIFVDKPNENVINDDEENSKYNKNGSDVIPNNKENYMKDDITMTIITKEKIISIDEKSRKGKKKKKIINNSSADINDEGTEMTKYNDDANRPTTDDTNDQDMSSELSKTESAMNSYELVKKNKTKIEKGNLKMEEKIDDALKTPSVYELDKKTKPKEKKSSKAIKEENELADNMEDFGKARKKSIEKHVIKMLKDTDENNNSFPEKPIVNFGGSIDNDKDEKLNDVDEQNKNGKLVIKNKTKILDSNENNLNNQANEMKDDSLMADKKNKINTKNVKKQSKNDNGFIEEITETTIAMDEEWLEQQCRLKKKKKTLDNNDESSIANKDKDLDEDFSATDKIKKKKSIPKTVKHEDENNNNFNKEAAEQTVTTHEEWLKQQRRLKNKNVDGNELSNTNKVKDFEENKKKRTNTKNVKNQDKNHNDFIEETTETAITTREDWLEQQRKLNKKNKDSDNNDISDTNQDKDLKNGIFVTDKNNKNKIDLKNIKHQDRNHNGFIEETTETTITTHEEWLEQQRRIKNKNKVTAKQISEDKNSGKQVFETNFDDADPNSLVDNKQIDDDNVNKRKENKNIDSDDNVVTEILSPSSKYPLKRNIPPIVYPERQSRGNNLPQSKFVDLPNETKNEQEDQRLSSSNQKGHIPRKYSAPSKSFEENVETTTTVVETVITDRWKRRSRRRPKSVSFENIPRHKLQAQDRPLSVKPPDKTLEQAAFEMLQVNQAEAWRKNWKSNPVVYTRGVYRPQQPLYKRDGGVDGNVSFRHDESRVSQAFPPLSEIQTTNQSHKDTEIKGDTIPSTGDGFTFDSPPQHFNNEDGFRYNEHVEEYVGDDHIMEDHHANQQKDVHHDNHDNRLNRSMPGLYGKGYSPIIYNSISRKVTYLKPIKRRRGYNSLSLYPIRGITNQSTRDLPPQVSDPVPSDLNKFGYVSKLWMEQVDKKTLQKSETMYLSVLPKGMKLPESSDNALFKKYLNNTNGPNDNKTPDVDGSQWVIARGRSVRQAKRKWQEQKENKLLTAGDFGNLSFADVTGNISPTRSTANKSFTASPGHPTSMLFFKIGQINWPDLAWVLFDGIQNDAETVRMIADVRLKNPDDCGAQVRDLMSRWWTKKGEAATIEELQTALEFVQIPFVQEEDQHANFFYPAKDHDEDQIEEGEEEFQTNPDSRKSLLLTEVSENDPDISRMMHEYEQKSPNTSYAALADHSQLFPSTFNKNSSSNLLNVPSFRASKQIQQPEDQSDNHMSFSSALKDKYLPHSNKTKSTSKQHSMPANMAENSTNLGSESSFRIFSSSIFSGKNKKSKNDSIVNVSGVEDESLIINRSSSVNEKPTRQPYLAKNVDLESNL